MPVCPSSLCLVVSFGRSRPYKAFRAEIEPAVLGRRVIVAWYELDRAPAFTFAILSARACQDASALLMPSTLSILRVLRRMRHLQLIMAWEGFHPVQGPSWT